MEAIMKRNREGVAALSATLGACALLAGALLSSGCAATGQAPPASWAASGTWSPGRFVWFDLVTDDPAAAKTFYSGMFGWTFEQHPNYERYWFVTSGGERIGGMLAIARKPERRISQWIGYVSVTDVDTAVAEFTSRGGTLHKGPIDIPGRGRAALVADPQGALVAVLHADTGDPPAVHEPRVNHWMWVDYVANDVQAATAFYKETFGYRAEAAEHDGDEVYYLFKDNDRPRAGMFRNPWPHVRPNWVPYVRVEDAAAMAARAVQLGGSIVAGPRQDLRNGSVAMVLDPTGAGIVLQKYPF
jgi:predicted enzyme related to lactoylglutathione lyase